MEVFTLTPILIFNKQKLKNAGFNLHEQLDSPYEGVTHEVVISSLGIDPIPVILLEERLKIIRQAT